MTIILAGGSGFIGSALTKAFLAKGATVIVVDTVGPKITNEKLFYIPCDLTKQTIPFGVLEHADVVINLCGAPIAQKWTPEAKQVIYDSRILSTRNIVQSLSETKARPGVFICASAIGIYGDTGEQTKDETSEKGNGFLADVVHDWEQEAEKAEALGVRTVSIRTAPVLGLSGILAMYTQTARFGFILGMKKDFSFSWIHIDDLVQAYIFAIETSTVQGAINAVAPEEVSYKTLMSELGHALHRKVFFIIPKKALVYKFAEEGYSELTLSMRVAPTRLLGKGFVFSYPTLREALQAIYAKK